MSSREWAIVAAVAMAAVFVFVGFVMVTQPQAHARHHNAYWPYSVEMSVKDK